MHCTSYIPMRCQQRGRNVCESGFSWHPLTCDEKNGEETHFPSFNMNQHLDFNKEVLSQIIQKHEATFRYQLQELHRLYRRQRELMDENRVRQIYTQHLMFQAPDSNNRLPQTRSEISLTASHTASWILGNSSDNLSVLTTKDVRGPIFVAENFQDSTIAGPGLLLTKNSCNGAKSFSSGSESREMRIWNLQLPADVYRDSNEVVNVSKRPAQDSELGPVKMGDFWTSNMKHGNGSFLIDLNEPIQLEPMESSSTSSFEPYMSHNEIMCIDPVVSAVAEPKSVVSEHSVGINLTGIDLNSMPLSCLSEAVTTVEILPNTNEESKAEDPRDHLLSSRAKQDCDRRVPFSSENEMSYDSGVGSNSSSVHDHPTSKGMLEEDPILDVKISDKSLKTKAQVGMNTSIILEETFPSFSSEEIDLEAPVSPENKEGFPPRGKSEDILLDATSLLSEQIKSKPEIELDGIAAETLLSISYSGVQDFHPTSCLCWFADIVSSACDVNNLENKVMKLLNDKDRGKLQLDGTDDFNIKKPKPSLKNAVNLPFVAYRSARDRGTKDLPLDKFFRRTSSVRRNSCSKSKNSKLSCYENKKSVTSLLKDPGTVSWGWGNMKKRQGGHRRRANKFHVIS